jgi:asparagine synthase (glutamine-hydrolysing)
MKKDRTTIAKEIKKHATVALSGECADEMFGGYPWFFRTESLNSNTFPWSLSVNQRSSILSPQIRELIDVEYYSKQRYLETLQEVPKLDGESKENARIREIFYLNHIWFMTTLLDRKDRMSMATGLEVRVPFCDHRLVEYAWNIPWKMKTVNNMEKGILRRSLEEVLPKEILYRKKSPYPKTHNPKYADIVSNMLLKIIEKGESYLLELVNINSIKELALSKGVSYTYPWFGQLMTGPQLIAYLIQIDYWLNKYKVQIEI